MVKLMSNAKKCAVLQQLSKYKIASAKWMQMIVTVLKAFWEEEEKKLIKIGWAWAYT